MEFYNIITSGAKSGQLGNRHKSTFNICFASIVHEKKIKSVNSPERLVELKIHDKEFINDEVM